MIRTTPAAGSAHRRSKHGYMLLMLILIVGTVATAIVASLLFLGTTSGNVSLAVQQSTQAMALAQGCAEYALQKLRDSPAYGGNEQMIIGNGDCAILGVGGTGNTNRLLCAEGQVGENYRRLEIIVKEVLPQTKIYSWQEVPVFSLCF
ncbi:MAG TPA: hypothetical protein PKV72_00890 [Candidatus Peribacteria bacterium]|nr:hypothetical protein [Candidatus Peribacteria bacterium]